MEIDLTQNTLCKTYNLTALNREARIRFSKLLNTRGIVEEEKVMDMSINQLVNLGNDINLDVSQNCSKEEYRKQFFLKLEWLEKQAVVKAQVSTPWVPPDVNAGRSKSTHVVSVNNALNLKPEKTIASLRERFKGSKLRLEFEALKAENSKLLSRPQRSEKLRIEMEKKLSHTPNRKHIEEDLEKFMRMKKVRAVRVHQAGLLFDLSDKIAVLRAIDTSLAEINHASRDSKEHPMVIVSENELEMLSYPISNGGWNIVIIGRC